MTDAVNGGATAAPAETYEQAFARIRLSNTAGDYTRAMSDAQVAELQSIAQRQWGSGSVSANPADTRAANPAPQAHDLARTATAATAAGTSATAAASADPEAAFALLTPYGLQEHARRETAGEAIAVARLLQAEGIVPEQANGMLHHLRTERPTTDAQMMSAFGSLSEEDDDLVVDYLNGLDDAHPQLRILQTLRRSGLLANVGFLKQVAMHARGR